MQLSRFINPKVPHHLIYKSDMYVTHFYFGKSFMGYLHYIINSHYKQLYIKSLLLRKLLVLWWW